MRKSSIKIYKELTKAERRVLRLLFLGKSPLETAGLLCIERKTVYWHCYRAYRRLCAGSLMEARVNAERLGLLPSIMQEGSR